MKRLSLFLIVAISCLLDAVPHRRRKVDPEVIAQEAHQVYKKVERNFAELLDLASTIQEAPLREKDFYRKKLIESVIRDVKQDRFPLYGNFFNKVWRNITAFSVHMPLKRFDYTILEDSIGHVQKAYNKLLCQGIEDTEITGFLASLNKLRELVQSSVYYKLEEERVLREQAEVEVCRLQASLSLEVARRQEAEKNLAVLSKQLTESKN